LVGAVSMATLMCFPFRPGRNTHLEMRIMSLRENENPHKMPGEQQQRVMVMPIASPHDFHSH